MTVIEVAGENHLSIMNEFEHIDGELFKAMTAMINI